MSSEYCSLLLDCHRLLNGLIVQWLRRTDIVRGEQTVDLPISFSNTDFLCFKLLQAWNDNSTSNNQTYAMPITEKSIKTFGHVGYKSFIFAIGI